MEQLMKLKLSGDIPCLSSIPLGTFHNNTYYIGDECLSEYLITETLSIQN
jgi:hypothetical protein